MNITDNPYTTSGTGLPPPSGTKSPLAGTNIISKLLQPTVTQPDWQKLLDQYMQPYQSIYDAQMAALQQRIAAQSQLANQRFSGSDTSTMARLSDEHSDLARRIVNTLAGQGLYNSGATGFQQGREDLRYKRAQTDASNQLLDYLTGLQNQLADAQYQGQLGLANTRLGLGTTIGSLYQPTVGPSKAASILGTGWETPLPPTSSFSKIFGKAYGG